MYQVIVRWPNGNTSKFEINKEIITLGRAPDSDVFLPSELASRNHASIYRKLDQVVIEDLNSSNGTYLGTEKIVISTEITPYDVVKIGDVQIRVRYVDQSEESKNLVQETGSTSIAERLGDHSETVYLRRDRAADLRRMLRSASNADKTIKNR